MTRSRYSKETLRERADRLAGGEMLLDLATVVIKTNLSRSFIYDSMAKGAFPKPLKLSPRRVAWRLDEIEAWIAAREKGLSQCLNFTRLNFASAETRR